jgi:hypothetical protein
VVGQAVQAIPTESYANAQSAAPEAIAQSFAVSAEAERGRSSAERGSGKANRNIMSD